MKKKPTVWLAREKPGAKYYALCLDPMPNDYIKSSQVIQEFLDRTDIKIEVDDCAPVICNNGLIDIKDGIIEEAIRRPYFGPGGADNCLKAFVGLHQAGIASIQTLRTSGNGESHIQIAWRKNTGVSMWINEEVYTENIPIALHDLLYKMATEEK